MTTKEVWRIFEFLQKCSYHFRLPPQFSEFNKASPTVDFRLSTLLRFVPLLLGNCPSPGRAADGANKALVRNLCSATKNLLMR